MTLAEIARALQTTSVELRNPGKGLIGHEAQELMDLRREFIHRAFAAGHEPEAIGAYIDRTQITVTHALRMCAMDNHGGDYGRTEAELKFAMRSAA